MRRQVLIKIVNENGCFEQNISYDRMITILSYCTLSDKQLNGLSGLFPNLHDDLDKHLELRLKKAGINLTDRNLFTKIK